MQGSDLKERLRAPMPTRVVGHTPISGIREIDWDWPKIEAERAEAASEIERLEAELRKMDGSWGIAHRHQERTIAAAEAQRDQLAEALRKARIWHESEDKSLSKQPPTGGPNGNMWARLQHQEQMAEIDVALSLLEQKP